MANNTNTYILMDDLICSRQVLPEGTGNKASMTVSEWLKSDPDIDQVYEALLEPIGPGIRFVTSIRGDLWYSEFGKILEYCPELKPRNDQPEYLFDGDKWQKRRLNAFGSGFPPGYASCLTNIDFSGWQFFSYNEMEMIVEGIRKFFASEEEVIYEPEWQEIILDYEKYEYDLFLIVHMV